MLARFEIRWKWEPVTMEKVSISRMRKAAAAGLAVYIPAYYLAMALSPGLSPVFSDWFTLLGEGAGIAIIGVGLRWREAKCRTAWRIFLAGSVLNFTADLIWDIYEIPLRRTVPFPSLCDVFYLSASVCCLIALIFYIRHEELFDVLRAGFDILITMVVSTTIMVKYVMLPIWNDNTMTLLQKGISLAYPVFDLGYLGGLFSLLFFCASRPKWNRSNLLIGAAFLIWLFADVAYAVRLGRTYVPGGFLDPLWPIGCWVLALAVLYPYGGETREVSAVRSEAMQYLRMSVPYLGAGVIVILVSYQYLFKAPLVTGAAITVFLIMVRQIFSLLENKRLIRMIQKSNLLLKESKAELEEKNTKLQALNYLKEYEANTDFLTGIFNRRYINETLQAMCRNEAGNETMRISVLLIDVDHYKQINDRMGHNVGDAVLQKIASLVKSSIRTKDIVGRFGGDEFIVILPNAELEAAGAIAERILQRTFREEFAEDGNPLKVTLSIGCVGWKGAPQDYDINAIIAAADKALYAAKAGGRNQCRAEAFGGIPAPAREDAPLSLEA